MQPPRFLCGAVLALLAAMPVRASWISYGVPAAARSDAAGRTYTFQAFDARGPGAPRARLLQGRFGAPLRQPAAGVPEALARRFLDEEVRPAGELVHLGTVEAGGGVRFVGFEQRFSGLPVLLGRMDVAVAPDGSILAARIGELAPAPPRERVGGGVPLADADAAVSSAARVLGWEASELMGGRWLHVDRALLATATGAVPVWRVRLTRKERIHEQAEVVLGARDGRPWRTTPLAATLVEGARVWPRDPAQGSATVAFPHPATNPSMQSPIGWSYDDDQTTGNNVWAQLDREADFFPPYGATAVASGNPPILDFPFTGDPRADADAALTNVFWALNDAHDRFLSLGFDEASGAMQQDSLGRGGLEGDRVWALVQYESGDGTNANNAVFSGFGADGSFSWIAVGLFDESGELRDAAFETDLLYHEYTHGVVTRLVGNDAACRGGAQPQALVEGWSDFFAASFTGDTVIGAWVSGDDQVGLRADAVDRTRLSLFNFCLDGCNAFEDGLIWAGTLWDIRTAMISRYGPEEGVRVAEELIVEGMRYTPCRPTFLEARDALLLADTALHDGVHRCDLWNVFSVRGMGGSATTTGPDDEQPLAAADPAPECAGGASLWLDQPEYGLEAQVVVEAADDAPPAGTVRVDLTTSSGDTETLDLQPVAGSILHRAEISLEAGPPVPGDGVLQGSDGDTLTAAYADRGIQATAVVTGSIPVAVATHRVWGDCRPDPNVDDDSIDGFYNLTGYLDAGESADLVVTFGHEAPVALREVEVEARSLSPDVSILPSTPLTVGDVGPKEGPGPRMFEAVFRVQAAPTVVTGDTAELRFTIRALGRESETALVLDLNRDYVLEPELSAFDGGVETFESSSSTVGQWTHQPCIGTTDWWLTDGCAGNGGAGTMVGSDFCGPYGWTDQSMTLLSPPVLPLPADAVALRFLDLSWWNFIGLYTDPANPYCDADMVGVFFTGDPATLPCGDPLAIYSYDPLRVYLFVDNTDGWRPSGPFGLNTAPILLDPAADYGVFRLAWVFWGDIIECFDTRANTGTYRIDDVRFTYDLVRWVPESDPCDQSCLLRTTLAGEGPDPLCPGDPFEIVAAGTEAIGCPGAIRYSYGGPGVEPPYDWTYEERAPAVAEDGATYSVYAQCEDIAECNHYVAAGYQSPANPGVGSVVPGSLRLAREDSELTLRFSGGAAPPSFGIFSVADAARLLDPLAAWDALLAVEANERTGLAEGRLDLGAQAPGLVFYQAAATDPCTGLPR